MCSLRSLLLDRGEDRARSLTSAARCRAAAELALHLRNVDGDLIHRHILRDARARADADKGRVTVSCGTFAT